MVGRKTVSQAYGQIKRLSVVHLFECSTHAQKYTITDGEGVLLSDKLLASHTDWLLVFDNTEDLALVEEYIPTEHKGHVLLTTLIQEDIVIDRMDEQEGAEFLLRRAKDRTAEQYTLDRASPEEQQTARDISRTLDGHPLALDKAGVYILKN